METRSALLEKKQHSEQIFEKDSLSVKEVVQNVMPIIFGLLIGWCQININLIFMGFLNDTVAQDAIGLSQLFVNFLGVGVFFGMNGALETLASQALGKQDYKMCGFYLQQGRIINIILFVPILILLVASPHILILAGQNREVAEKSGQFLIAYAPGILLMGLNDLNQRLLIQMGYQSHAMKINCIGAAFHVVCNFVLVIWLRLGVVGSGLSCTFTNLSIFFMLQVLQRRQKSSEWLQILSIPFYRVQNLDNAWQYVRLGAPAGLIMCMDWGAYEILTMMSASFGVAAQTSVILTWNFFALIYQMQTGFQFLSCSYVGKEIGAGNYKTAREYQQKIFNVGLFFCMIQIIVQIIFRENQLRMFTSDEEVIEEARGFYKYVIFLMFFDFNQNQTQGTIKAMGRQNLASIISLFTYFGVGVSLSYILAFEKIPVQFLQDHFNGTRGIMFAQTIAIFLNCIGFLLIVWGPGHEQRWRQSIKEAQVRNQEEQQQEDQMESWNTAINEKSENQ